MKEISREQLIADLTAFSCDYSPFISIVGATRKKGNPNNKIECFFDSLLKMTSDISHVEVVFRIDEDDDLAFFHGIRELFGKQVRMRFVIQDTVNGYRNLHLLHTSAYENTTPTSGIIFLATDDATFREKNWDTYFIGFAQAHKDNIFFINPSHPHLLNYENKFSYFWHLWCYGPTACLPGIGRRVMTICKKIADKYPGWTPYSNNILYDSFNETLQYYMYEITGKRPALAHMPQTLVIEQDKEIAAHKEGGVHSSSPAICDNYREFLSDNTQAIIKEMSQALCDAQGTIDALSHAYLEKELTPTLPGKEVVISIIAKPYKINAQEGFYDKFIQSLLQKTEQITRVEIIFIMTSHVNYYKRLAKEYGDKVRIVLLYADSAKRNGLSLIDDEMLSRMAPSSKMLCVVNEAVIIDKMHWDKEILSISHNYFDQLFFINLHSHCGTNYEEKAVFFWEMLRSGYPGFSQMISRRVVENIYQFALSRHTKPSNECRADYLFIGAVQYYLWKITGVKRAQLCENIFVTNEDYCPGNPARNPAEAFYDFMQPNVQEFFQKVAAHLANLASAARPLTIV